jgi:hypothetical protein
MKAGGPRMEAQGPSKNGQEFILYPIGPPSASLEFTSTPEGRTT